jgi:hypothetical protein
MDHLTNLGDADFRILHVVALLLRILAVRKEQDG